MGGRTIFFRQVLYRGMGCASHVAGDAAALQRALADADVTVPDTRDTHAFDKGRLGGARNLAPRGTISVACAAGGRA